MPKRKTPPSSDPSPAQASSTIPVAPPTPPSTTRSKPAERERLSYYDRKLASLSEELAQVRAGTHPDLQTQLNNFRVKRDRQITEADLLKALRHKEVEALYDYQVKEAHDIYASSSREASDRLQAELEASLTHTKSLRDAPAVPNPEDALVEDAPQPKPPTRPLQTRNAASANNPTPTPKTEFSISYSAPLDQIAADLTAIHHEWLASASKYHSQAEIAQMAVRVEDNKLFINELAYEKSSPLVVKSESTKETFYGTVVHISPLEILIKLNDGSKSRILVSHIRSGRCKVSPGASAVEASE